MPFSILPESVGYCGIFHLQESVGYCAIFHMQESAEILPQGNNG